MRPLGITVNAPTRSLARTLLQLAPPVLLSIGGAVGLVAASRRFIALTTLAPSNDVVGNYLQTLGTIYAVLLAFVVYVVWTQFNEVRAAIDREANEARDLFRTVGALPEPMRGATREALVAYARGVLDEEWEAMRRCDGQALLRCAALLEGAWAALRAFEPASEGHKALYSEALQRFNDLSDARTLRISAGSTRIPMALRVLLYAGAMVLVASMAMFGVRSFAVHAVIAGALAGSLSHLLVIVEDLDHPFAGNWQVSRGPFVRFLASAEEERTRDLSA